MYASIRPKSRAAVLLVAALFLASCSTTQSATSGPLTVLLVTDFSGATSYVGKLYKPIIGTACNEINKAGGVLGHSCNVEAVDDHGDPTDGAVALRQALATTKNILAVTGLITGTAGSEVPLVVGANDLTLTFSGATAYIHPRQLFGSKGSLVYTVYPPDEMLGFALAFAANKSNVTRPAVIVSDTPDTASTLAGLTTANAAIGITPSIVLKLANSQTSYGTEVEQLIASKPDGLIINLTDTTTAATFLSNLITAMGTIRVPMFSDDIWITKDFYNGIKSTIPLSTLKQHLRIVTPAPANPNNPGLQPLKAAYASLNLGQQDTAITGPGYDTIILAALAMLQTHSTDARTFAPAMAQIAATSNNSGRARVDTFAQGKAAIAKGEKIEFWGAYGPLNWTADHARIPDYDVFPWALTPSGPAVGGGGPLAVIAGSTVISRLHL